MLYILRRFLKIPASSIRYNTPREPFSLSWFTPEIIPDTEFLLPYSTSLPAFLYPIFHSISWSEDFNLCEANCVYFAQWSRLSLNTFNIILVSISFVLSTAVTIHCTSFEFSSDSPIIHLLESSPAPNDVFPLPREASAEAWCPCILPWLR